MNEVEFAEAYQKHRGTLTREIERRVSGSDLAEEILHRALFGRPVKDRDGKREHPVAGGMYEDREGIPAEDFLRRARGYVRNEIKQWHREREALGLCACGGRSGTLSRRVARGRAGGRALREKVDP